MATAMYATPISSIEGAGPARSSGKDARMALWRTLILVVAVGLAGGVLLRPTPARAWGAEGHKVVALIAMTELTPSAKRQIQQILGGDLTDSMEDASVWADQIRRYRRETAPWHYVDIEITSQGYNAQRDCHEGNCVVAQIGKDIRVLGDRNSPAALRVEALKFLIHFVGDVHQPLHCADNHDRGGNEIHVVAGRRHANLHEIWDADVVRALGRQPEAVSSHLAANITESEKRRWARGSAIDWANESFGIAKSEIYGRNRISGTMTEVSLPQGYARSEDQIAAVQLQKAGVRLAILLNRILGR